VILVCACGFPLVEQDTGEGGPAAKKARLEAVRGSSIDEAGMHESEDILSLLPGEHNLPTEGQEQQGWIQTVQRTPSTQRQIASILNDLCNASTNNINPIVDMGYEIKLVSGTSTVAGSIKMQLNFEWSADEPERKKKLVDLILALKARLGEGTRPTNIFPGSLVVVFTTTYERFRDVAVDFQIARAEGRNISILGGEATITAVNVATWLVCEKPLLLAGCFSEALQKAGTTMEAAAKGAGLYTDNVFRVDDGKGLTLLLPVSIAKKMASARAYTICEAPFPTTHTS
jgi:hypothetical protein